MAFKSVKAGSFMITGDNRLIKVSLPDKGHIQFTMGEEPELKNMLGSLIRLSTMGIPTGTKMKFGSYGVTYTENSLTIQNTRSLLNINFNQIHELSETLNTAMMIGNNVKLSRPNTIHGMGNAVGHDTLSGQYSENT